MGETEKGSKRMRKRKRKHPRFLAGVSGGWLRRSQTVGNASYIVTEWLSFDPDREAVL